MRLRERLRAGTREAHDRVDAAFAHFDLTTGEGYRDFLTAHAAALPAMEAAVEEAGATAVLPDWPERRRTGALLGDLRQLGLSAPERQAAPALEGEAELLGTLYVLEGSRLGARLLLAEARRGPHARATAYLAHGAGRRFWPEFLQVLETRPVGEAEALAGARAAFAAFEAAALRPLRAAAG